MDLRRWKAESKLRIHRLRYSPTSVAGSWRKKKTVLFLITLLCRFSDMQVAGQSFLQSSRVLVYRLRRWVEGEQEGGEW